MNRDVAMDERTVTRGWAPHAAATAAQGDPRDVAFIAPLNACRLAVGPVVSIRHGDEA
jgi:hypothetical protein